MINEAGPRQPTRLTVADVMTRDVVRAPRGHPSSNSRPRGERGGWSPRSRQRYSKPHAQTAGGLVSEDHRSRG
jgi:hypothetical protein